MSDGTIDRLAVLEAEVEELRASRARFVDAEPDPRPPGREADDAELTEWQRSLRERTRPVPPDFHPDTRPYNHRPRWFMKPDGTVVQLQGSPQALSYYQEKGFLLLTPDQEKQYLGVERPKILRLQQRKASLINTLRRVVDLDPSLKAGLDPGWDEDLSHMTADELEAQLTEIQGMPTASGAPRKVLRRLPRLQDAEDRRAQAESRKLLEGVETEPSRVARETFEASMPPIPRRSGAERLESGRDIEVTAANINQFR